MNETALAPFPIHPLAPLDLRVNSVQQPGAAAPVRMMDVMSAVAELRQLLVVVPDCALKRPRPES